MKFFRYILLASLLISGNVVAQEKEGSKILVNNQSILIDDNRQVVVTMDITLPGNLEVPTNNVLTITPVLKDSTGTHMATLPSVMVYGRNRYLIDERANDIPADAYTVLRREKETDQSFDYTTRISYEKWMHGADLELASEIKGCANCKEEENSMYVTSAYLERYTVKPQVVFVEPEVEQIKNRIEQGRAYLDFPVNKTTIYPEYRRNPDELKEIRRTIDVVKNDDNVKITGIHIDGYASPEGGFRNNARLAQGRAEALKNYVKGEYEFAEEIFKVTSTPEDWAGLKKYVEENNVDDKEEILAIINGVSGDNHDAQEAKMKNRFPATYAKLYKDVYPGLRHSDYLVFYTVRAFDIEEAKRIIKERPQQLSLQEMYLVAQTYEHGSAEFKEVFDVAVRMFPQDPTANINAAAIELEQGNLNGAVRFLQKSSQDEGATLNNYGVLKLLQGDLDAAESYFRKAQQAGIEEAAANLLEVEKKRKDFEVFGK
jgi:outer membrane protein OmpA-like peptidoglycan-associated protein